MINIIPQSEVRLLKTPLEKDSEHTLKFASLSDQTTYFLSNVVKTYSDFTYIREQQTIVVSDNYDTIYTCNYLMYKNNGFNNKYFYAFITKMEYVSENSTRIYFEIDSLQTWFFQLNMNQVFVEREHVSDDTIGLHTVPEQLETGEYVNVETSTSTTIGTELSICVATSKHIDTSKNVSTPNGRSINGIYQGLEFAILSDYPNLSSSYILNKEDATNMYVYFFGHTTGASTDDVIDIFMIPTAIIGSNYEEVDYQFDSGSKKIRVKFLTDTTSEILLENYLLKDNKNLAGNYVPVNNKLLCYPYRYLLASNGTGQEVIYNWEYFEHNNQDYINFKSYGDLTPNCSIKCIPQNYKNLTNNYIEAINFSKYPTCSWIYDAYTNWLTQNGVNSSLRTLNGLGKIGSNLITQGKTGDIKGGIMDIFNVAMEQYQHQFDPNQARGNICSGDINFTMTKNEIQFYKMSIKPEYASIIDSYFSMYGYKINKVKIPNITSRRNYNYIKTIHCNFTGDIPQEDLQKIKDIFNSGVTFWHNPENYLNYSVNNDII